MARTIKEVLDQILGEIGHPIESSYYSGNNHVITAVANRSILSLTKNPFTELKKKGAITMTSETAYPLPDDYRYLIFDSMNAVDNERAVEMPTSDKKWHYLQSQSGQNGISYKCRIFDGSFNFETVESGQVINYEYLSKYGVAASNSKTSTSRNLTGTKERFTSDTDYFLVNDNLLEMDILWRYGKTKNVEGWQADKQLFDAELKTHLSSEAGAKTLDMSCNSHDGMVSPYYPLWQS